MVIGNEKNNSDFKRILVKGPIFTEHNTIVVIPDASPSIFHSTLCVAIKK
jgi:hypothetical protein